MSKNRDIRAFFGKKTAQQTAPYTNSVFQLAPQPEQTHQPTPPVPSREPSLDLPSSPVTPQKKNVRTPLTRDVEIKGSDDDDSDASLESLGELIGRKSGPSYQRPPTLATTPKAKRIASGNFHRSPLTLQQQAKHKFDLKTLLSHVRQDDATDESARRADQAKAQAEKELEPEADPDRMAGEAFSDEDEARGDKLAMAIDRTTAGEESRPRAYFFNPEGAPPKILRRPFPKKVAKAKPWNILQDASSRSQMFIHGLPTALARRGKELPDELYLWILDEICVESDLLLRNQYIKLAALCHEDTGNLVDEELLYHMLEKIGGQEHSTASDRFELSPALPNQYSGRDWSPLRSFLELLAQIGADLTPEDNVSAIKLLLRLSLDPIITTVAGLRVAYSKAMLALISALPEPKELWSDYCMKICNYLYGGVDQASQRSIAITLLPTSAPRTVELQRRLALEALLDEPNLGAKHPDEAINMQDLFNRLSKPDFQVTNSTDFGELNALITLLDIVVHDGSYLYHARLSPPTASSSTSALTPIPTPSTLASPSITPSPASEAEARAKYDADIDRLVVQLKVLHDKISDNTLVSKKEAKLALDGMMKRLTNTVRSRPPPKTSIFDGILTSKEDVNLPKQKDFMKKWTTGKASREGK
ncbi:hypothetical protein SCUP234_10011 [Seiridium cupressi]